jgi:mannosyltransferase OCH1-like enzyme
MSIPKHIVQCWFGPMRTGALPPPLQEQNRRMLEINPGYSHTIFDDVEMANFIKDNYPQKYYDAYSKLQIGAAKADYWRYLYLYKNGGVYLDMDSIIYGCLDDLIGDSDCVVSREGIPGKFVQWCLMTCPGHPLFQIIIDTCTENIESGKIEDVTVMTGPVAYTKSIYKYLKIGNVYDLSDNVLNRDYSDYKIKFYSSDYANYANYWSPHKDLLYANSGVHWRAEQQRVYGSL